MIFRLSFRFGLAVWLGALLLEQSVRPTGAASGHWSLQPIRKPDVPIISSLYDNPIDQFVGAALHARKLAMSPPADPHTLIRRASFGLVGLPPTLDEVNKYERDPAPDRYQRLVERLLASPHYGEKWARHWLDAVRFAETHGFEMNQPRPNAWPYRDYVIRAFNEDEPYDRFVLEQLAGDVVGVDEATGFLVAGAWDQVKSPDPVLTANQRADELHDIVSTTGSTFLALTVGCARCHDHKFDPIPQKDYYAMKSVFEGVQHGERKRRPRSEGSRRESEMATLKRELAGLEREIEATEPLASAQAGAAKMRSAVNSRRNLERFAPVSARHLRFTITQTTDAEPCLDELEVYTRDGRNVALAEAGTTATASSVYPNSALHRLEHLNDGKYGNGRSWISNEPGKGWVQLAFKQPVIISKIVWARDREGKFSDRLATEYRIEVRSPDDEWQVIASSADRLPNGSDHGTSEKAGSTRTPLLARRAELEGELRRLGEEPMAYAGKFTADPEPTPRLNRGDPMQPRETVHPGALSALPLVFNEEACSSSLTEDQRRRLAFAYWVTDRRNPLTARVMVNRIWQYHFGQGLVSTPSDFGENGGHPTHPELLDWLAAEFMEHDWSIKHIQRLILNSSTYRQSSSALPEGIEADAGDQFLWRFPPRRLEAELIRDSVLAISGALDMRCGGPGFAFFEPNENYVRVYAPRASWPPETFRRMVYGTVVRQRPDGVFGAFDCPDGGQIAPRRTSSTTPLQALNLLNSSFVMEQAEFLARRVQSEAGSNPSAQVRRLFALAFQRAPGDEESRSAEKLLESEGLAILCRAVFNASEFVYVF